MGDRLGQRKVFLRIVIWWSLFTALTGAITGLTSLIIVRFLFGMGEAGAYPNSTGAVSRWFPKSETSRGISWFSMGSSSGAALAPLIVVPIAITFGWRAPFLSLWSMGQLFFCRLDAKLPAGRQAFLRTGNENDYELVVCFWGHLRLLSRLFQRLADPENGPTVFPPGHRDDLLYYHGDPGIPIGGEQQPPGRIALSHFRPFFSTFYRGHQLLRLRGHWWRARLHHCGYRRVAIGCDAMDRTRCVKKARPDDYAPVAGKSATAASVVNNLKVKLSCR